MGVEETENRKEWEILIRRGGRDAGGRAVNDRDERMRDREERRRLENHPTP